MNNTEFISTHQWSLFGSTYPFFVLNSETVIHTWIILFFTLLCMATVKFFLNNTKMGRFVLISIVNFFVDLTKQSFGSFVFSHCVFTSALFLFVALCNTASIIPGLDEPTSDINTTLALGIIAFLYIQAVIIKTHGLKSYIKDFFKPFFVMFPLNIIGKLSSIVSMSLRLFGNIFGGSIITKLYFSGLKSSIIFQLLGIFTGMNIVITLFFTLFEGLLQAFVLTMLTLTSIAMGASDEGGH